MIKSISIIILCFIQLLPKVALAEEFQQTLASCSVMHVKNLQYIEMHKNNVPLEKVVSYEMARNENTQNAEAIYKSLNEEGLKSTVYGENATFINCIHLVKNYSQIANSNPYKQCYIVAEFDFVILKSIDDGIPVEKIIENVGRSESERVIAMKKMVDEKNIESVQSILSDQYTACAINALKTDPPIIK